MRPFEGRLYIALAALGCAAAVAVGFWRHNILYWGPVLFFLAVVLNACDRPVFPVRGLGGLGRSMILTKEDYIDLLENRMLYGDPERAYYREIRVFNILLLALGWGIVIYGALRGQSL